MIKAIYIGAGTDLHYIQYMPEEITNFYLIHSQPFSEDGIRSSWGFRPEGTNDTNSILCSFAFIFRSFIKFGLEYQFTLLKKQLFKKGNIYKIYFNMQLVSLVPSGE